MIRRKRSAYGRLIPKPVEVVGEGSLEEQYDDVLPIQEQLEGLAVKIQLKELYNNVLKDELEETKTGASTILKQLHAETLCLRQELSEAYNSEKIAVQKALRTHREFQLAMTDRNFSTTIPWLDDKLYDISRRINVYSANLVGKRKKLEEAEHLVDQIERWPRPGTLPWEIEAISKFQQYESRIENMKVKLETANILFAKYTEIASVLKLERGKDEPIISTIQNQLHIFSQELVELQKTLKDAVGFRDSALRNLIHTQQEASENRRRRKIQMVKMKTAVRRVLESSANIAAAEASKDDAAGPQDVNPRLTFVGSNLSLAQRDLNPRLTSVSSNISLGLFAELIQYKREEIEKFEDRAGRLVETMRVPDLTFVPIRFQSVMSLGERLELELLAKEDLLDALLRQKAQLYILLAHFTYTGHNVTADFDLRTTQFQQAIDGTNAWTTVYEDRLQAIGGTMLKVRCGALRLLEQLENHRDKHAQRLQSDIFTTLKGIAEKVRKLVEKNAELIRICGTEEAERNYALYVKEPPLPTRLWRVADSGAEDSDSDPDEGVIDTKIASRLEMKARSLRFIRQARLRRRLR